MLEYLYLVECFPGDNTADEDLYSSVEDTSLPRLYLTLAKGKTSHWQTGYF